MIGVAEGLQLNRREHRGLAVAAHVQRGAGHAHDRRMLPTIGAHRTQLEAVQAVHAAIAAGEIGRAQPRLMAGRTDVAEVLVTHARRNLATKKPSVWSRCGNVCRCCGMVGCFQMGMSAPRSETEKSS